MVRAEAPSATVDSDASRSPPAASPRTKKIGAPVPRSLRPKSPPASFRLQAAAPPPAAPGGKTVVRDSSLTTTVTSVTPSSAQVPQDHPMVVSPATSSMKEREGQVPLVTSRRGGQSFGTAPQKRITNHPPIKAPVTATQADAYDDDYGDDDDDNAPRVFMMPTELQYVHRVVAASPSPDDGRRQQYQQGVLTSDAHWELEGRRSSSRQREPDDGPQQQQKHLSRAGSTAADRQYAAMRLEEYLVELLVEGRQDEYAQVKHALDQEWMSMTTPSSAATATSSSSGQAILSSSPPTTRWPPPANYDQTTARDSGVALLSSEVYWELVDRL
ncbi:Hypothetical protein, putative [Bodo saltans]|uniref:Uncharacterized protein n=1 Tax=Bodo saltans TaxID=75058 RepID=A0A0S4JJ83_BODSA|nr:Hypothetical protein, putative [Bodo saltans]|eukprot:CUG91541.1 Hypothetical protein, putative [Bodo saltans]